MPIDGHNSVRVLSECEQQFALWAFDAVGWHWTEAENVIELAIPESARHAFGGAEVWRFSRRRDDTPAPESEGDTPSTDTGTLTMESPAVAWLLDRLRRSPVLHASPIEQPTSVHEISAQLFAAYRIENGNVRLGGCTLETRPVVRISRWLSNSTSGRLRHNYSTPEGEPLDKQLEGSLGVGQVAVQADHPRVSDSDIASWCAAANSCPDSFPKADEVLVTTLIWCTYASGKLEFKVGGGSDSVAFSGWAATLQDGTQTPPPFHCRHTSDRSFDVGGTEDGRISTRSMIAPCEVTGRRVLKNDLEVCAATGSRVLPELLVDCPVSGSQVLQTEVVTCVLCQQEVGPQSVQDGRCHACRTLHRVSKDDPRMARILGEHPTLDRWRRWRLSETSRVYIACASSFLRRLLFIVDKESLELIRIAVGHRFSSRWADAPAADQNEYSKRGSK